MIGRVERVELVLGSALGNQYTTIDGTRYMTWFDLSVLPVKKGAVVEFEVRTRNILLNGNGIPSTEAQILRIIEN